MNALELYQEIVRTYPERDDLKHSLIDFLEGKKVVWNDLGFLEKKLKQLEPATIVELIGIFHQKDKESKTFARTNERKHLGIFYTSYNLARFIVKQTLALKKTDPTCATFLEPCSGTGNFVIAYLDEVLESGKKRTDGHVQKVINNIYCADIDSDAVGLLKRIIPAYLKKKHGVSVKIPPENYFTGNVLFEAAGKDIIKNDPKALFNVRDGFDVVITNPPYGLLKANANKYGDKSDSKTYLKYLVNYLRKTKSYPLNEGTLNYYKIFIEEIISNYTNSGSVIGLLIPRTILNDRHSEKLRNRIFENYEVSAVYTIPEKNGFFPDVAQAFCFFSLNKSRKGKQISIVGNVKNEGDLGRKPVGVGISKLKEISSSIITESNMGMKMLQKMHENPRLASLADVVNLRGELDLTLHKQYITDKRTSYPLVKGVDIKEFSLASPREYVAESFLEIANGKRQYVAKPRIVCQQISNIHSSKRLKFAFVGPDYILGNSCNFLTLRGDKGLFGAADVSLYYLLGILNSLLLDWRFRISNSNNHVANYELNELPIVVSGEKKTVKEIERISFEMTRKYDDALFRRLNILTLKLYNLDKEEGSYILAQYPRLYARGHVKNLSPHAQ